MPRINLIALYIGIFLGLSSVLIPNWISVPVIIVIAGLILGIALIFILDPDKPNNLISLFIISLALRLAVSIFLALISYIKLKHAFFLGADDYGFGLNAGRIVAAWKETGHIPLPNSLSWMLVAGELNYPYWLAYLYYFIGEYPLMPLFINCCLGSLSIIFVYLISKEIYDSKIAFCAALFSAFWPSTFLWSTQNLREAPIVFAILLVLWSVIKLKKQITKIGHWFVLIAAFFIIFKLRFTIAPILVISTIFSFLLFKKNQYKIILLLIIILSITLMNNWFGISIVLSRVLGIDLSNIFEVINFGHYIRTMDAQSSFLVGVDISTPLNFIIYMPKFILYILFAPFPWDVSKISQLFGALEMLIWLFLIIFAIRGIILTVYYKSTEASILLFFLVIMLGAFFIEGNVGTLFRHRALIWPILHIFISAGLFYYTKDSLLQFNLQLKDGKSR